MNQQVAVITTLCFFTTSNAFPTVQLTGKDAFTRTHNEITGLGIQIAIGKFIKQNNLTTVDTNLINDLLVVKEFFGDDADGLQEYERREKEIKDIVNGQEQSLLAYIHCNSEQIELAHNYIIQLRNQIRELASTADPNLALIRENIAKCLYTIQAFYSTSNWVEMDVERTYKDFGNPGKTLMSIAGSDVDTCTNCDNSGVNSNSCKDNLLVKDMLTSGYHSGQDVKPPYKTNTDITTGKCGFGGSSDTENGQRTATGGINKDRRNSIYSPHHHLHNRAFIAARQATEDFIIDPEVGIINELGNELFADVFNLNKRYQASFGFTIDVTGSMADNIAEVKKGCSDIVSDVLGTANEPLDYVLVTFSDPVELTTHVLTTTNGLEMVSTIGNLTVDGGGDCPEYAIDGLLKCIDKCRDHSTLFFFSDAPPKDEENKQAVIDAVLAKNIDLRIIITELCIPVTKRDLAGRNKRQTGGSTLYFEIAEATGGKVYQVTTSEISSVMQQISEEQFPSATSIIDMFSMDTTSTNIVNFPVDSMLYNLKVQITGAFDTSEVDIHSSSGSILTAVDTKVLFESPDKVIISVVSPSAGHYSLQRSGSNHWDVNITAQTAIDVDYSIMEEKDDYLYRLSGNPIIGKTYTIFVSVYNIPANASVTALVLRTNDGISSQLNLTNMESTFESIWYTFAVFMSESYQVGIIGEDGYGNLWMRTSAFTISPVNVSFTVSSTPSLYASTTGNVSYTLQNFGSEDETFIISVTDDRGLIRGRSVFSYVIPFEMSQEVIFQIEGSALYTTVTYRISVQKSGDTKVLQEDRKTIFISQHVPPTCEVEVLNGDCNSNGSCSSGKWNGQAVITFSGQLSSVTGTNGLQFTTSNLASSPVQVEASGECCLNSAYLTVIDINSNFVRCHFYLGEVTHNPESKTELSPEEKTAIGLIVGVALTSILVAIFLVVLIYRGALKTKHNSTKVNSTLTEKMKPTSFGNVPPRSTGMDHLHLTDLEYM